MALQNTINKCKYKYENNNDDNIKTTQQQKILLYLSSLCVKITHFDIKYVSSKILNNSIRLLYKSPSIFLNGIYLKIPSDFFNQSNSKIINKKFFYFYKNRKIIMIKSKHNNKSISDLTYQFLIILQIINKHLEMLIENIKTNTNTNKQDTSNLNNIDNIDDIIEDKLLNNLINNNTNTNIHNKEVSLESIQKLNELWKNDQISLCNEWTYLINLFGLSEYFIKNTNMNTNMNTNTNVNTCTCKNNIQYQPFIKSIYNNELNEVYWLLIINDYRIDINSDNINNQTTEYIWYLNELNNFNNCYYAKNIIIFIIIMC